MMALLAAPAVVAAGIVGVDAVLLVRLIPVVLVAADYVVAVVAAAFVGVVGSLLLLRICCC